jgi:hypothetical protein
MCNSKIGVSLRLRFTSGTAEHYSSTKHPHETFIPK